jgi:hypothetical protein
MQADDIRANAETIRVVLHELLSQRAAFKVEHTTCGCGGRCDLLHLEVSYRREETWLRLVVYSSSDLLTQNKGTLDWLVVEEDGRDLWRGPSIEAAAAFITSHAFKP